MTIKHPEIAETARNVEAEWVDKDVRLHTYHAL